MFCCITANYAMAAGINKDYHCNSATCSPNIKYPVEPSGSTGINIHCPNGTGPSGEKGVDYSTGDFLVCKYTYYETGWKPSRLVCSNTNLLWVQHIEIKKVICSSAE